MSSERCKEASLESPVAVCPGCGSISWGRILRAPDRFHGREKEYELVQCERCTLVWLSDPPPAEEMHLHYGNGYDRSVADAGEDPDRWRGRRDTVNGLKPGGGAVLDVGCSSGGFLLSLKGPKWRLSGIEMSEPVAQMARRSTGAEVFVGDVLDAPFAPRSFDVVTCFHVLEHMANPKDVLGRVREWLKPGGYFYMMVPNIDSAGARTFGSHWYALELPRHLFHFSPASLEHLAAMAGLEKISVTTHRELFFENSVRYLGDTFLRKAGIHRAPLVQAKTPGLPWRAARKGFRLTVLPIITALTGMAGQGESIHAIFRRSERS